MNGECKILLSKIEDVLNAALPQKLTEQWKTLSFGALDTCVKDDHIEVLTEPCRHLISLGGKRWRPLLLVLTSQMTQEAKNQKTDSKKALSLTPLVEFAHTASLIHDDIEDNADTRRGKPCAHITYGQDVAVNAGSWLYFEAASVIKNIQASAEEKLNLYDLFLTELRLLHLGQAMDIKWHRNPELIPSIEEYKAMVKNKTGTLARLAVKIGVTAAGGAQEEAARAGKIAEDIGVAFQIIDDVTNLTTGNPGKKKGDDIIEGKKSLPVLLHLKEHPGDKKRLSQLFQRAKEEGISSPAVSDAVSMLCESGAVEDARRRGISLAEEKCGELSCLFGEKTKSGEAISELFGEMLNSTKTTGEK